MNANNLAHWQQVTAKKLKIFGYTIYNRTPSNLRFVFWPMTFMRKKRLKQWLIKGEEVMTRQPLSIFFAGSKEYKNYLARLAFGEAYQEKYLGNEWSWQIVKLVKERKIYYPMIITEVPPKGYQLPGGNDSFYIPSLVRGKEVDITKNIEDFTAGRSGRSLKSDIRDIRKSRLYFDTTSDLSWFDYFYYHMYVPYTNKRYGNTAILFKFDSLRVNFETSRSELLFVKRDQEYLAGIMLTMAGKTGKLIALGIKDGSLEYLNMGVLGALYYFSYLHLREKGFRAMDLGGSHAFLKDGLLRYKHKWDPRIGGKTEPGFWLNFQIKNNAVRGFLENNPFIFIDDTGFNGAVFLNKDINLTESDFSDLYKNYYLEGMSRLCLYQCDGNCISQERVPPQFAKSVSLRLLDSESRKEKSESKYYSLEVSPR